MNDMTIEQFCDKHEACNEGRKWALENCTSMQDAWEKIKPDWLIWIATRGGVLMEKELRLFAVWSARQVQHLMTDSRSIDALDCAERYAHGNATEEELTAAKSAARTAALSAANSAAESAAKYAAKYAACSAAESAAESAANSAAWSAACSAACSAAESAAWSAQAKWLRENTKPNFKEESV